LTDSINRGDAYAYTLLIWSFGTTFGSVSLNLICVFALFKLLKLQAHYWGRPLELCSNMAKYSGSHTVLDSPPIFLAMCSCLPACFRDVHNIVLQHEGGKYLSPKIRPRPPPLQSQILPLERKSLTDEVKSPQITEESLLRSEEFSCYGTERTVAESSYLLQPRTTHSTPDITQCTLIHF